MDEFSFKLSVPDITCLLCNRICTSDIIDKEIICSECRLQRMQSQSQSNDLMNSYEQPDAVGSRRATALAAEYQEHYVLCCFPCETNGYVNTYRFTFM